MTQQGMAEQGDRIGHHGAGVKDIHAAGVFSQGANDAGGVGGLLEQDGSESFASGTAETPGQGGFAEIPVNKQYFLPA